MIMVRPDELEMGILNRNGIARTNWHTAIYCMVLHLFQSVRQLAAHNV